MNLSSAADVHDYSVTVGDDSSADAAAGSGADDGGGGRAVCNVTLVNATSIRCQLHYSIPHSLHRAHVTVSIVGLYHSITHSLTHSLYSRAE